MISCLPTNRYRDVNYVNVASPKDTGRASLRMALLGAVRFGKPIVFDLLDVDLWDVLTEKLDAIQAGLMDSLMNKAVLHKDCYERLIRPEDGEQYQPVCFTEDRLEKFRCFFITTSRFPDPEMVEQCYSIEVIPQPSLPS